MKKVLVTGADGQLGRCLKDAATNYPELEIVFASKETLNIDDSNAVSKYFEDHTFDYCINAAAYTNVERAESDSESSFRTNANALVTLANKCKTHNTVLIHISTDYVFDGKKRTPYVESDATNPINVYGASKLIGEEIIKDSGSSYYILRTSWLYSQYGKNFYTSMLRFAQDRKELAITTEETGTPTNANDLAEICLQVILEGELPFGTYHFSNEGTATWYDFAEAIFEGHHLLDQVQLSKTDHFETKARRPAYSVLNKEKIEKLGRIQIPEWRSSLKKLIDSLEIEQ